MKFKKQYGISTQIEYIDIKDILKNYKKSKYWKKKWCVFKTNQFKFNFSLREINIRDNEIKAGVLYEQTVITRGNKHFAFSPWWWDATTITIPIDNPEYRQEAFERALVGAIRTQIENIEKLVIYQTNDYKKAERSEVYYYDRVEELANAKLDEEHVTNEDIRDAYVDACRSNASCDYKSRVILTKVKTVFPNLYLMLYSWFNRPDDFERAKEEILEKQASLKSKLIGIKREQWIQNDKIESEEINEEIIDEVLEKI